MSVLVAAIVLATSSLAVAQDKPDIRLLTGPAGGTYYIMGAILAEALYRSGEVASATAEASSGSIESARRLESGEVPIAMMDGAWVTRARNAVAPFKSKIDLRTVMPAFVAPMFFVTLADSPIRKFEDMRGKRVAVGPRSSGMEQHARQVLKSLGWKFDDIKPIYLAFQPGGEAMRAGRADAQLQCCIPNAGFTELTTLAKLRVVEFTDSQLDQITKGNPDYGMTLLKKDSFPGHQADTPTIAISNGFMTHARVDERIVYTVAKVMISKLKEMAEKSPQFGTVEALINEAKTKGEKPLEVSAPLHAGAKRALKEAGILK